MNQDIGNIKTTSMPVKYKKFNYKKLLDFQFKEGNFTQEDFEGLDLNDTIQKLVNVDKATKKDQDRTIEIIMNKLTDKDIRELALIQDILSIVYNSQMEIVSLSNQFKITYKMESLTEKLLKTLGHV